jgi:hypothetical protein
MREKIHGKYIVKVASIRKNYHITVGVASLFAFVPLAIYGITFSHALLAVVTVFLMVEMLVWVSFDPLRSVEFKEDCCVLVYKKKTKEIPYRQIESMLIGYQNLRLRIKGARALVDLPELEQINLSDITAFLDSLDIPHETPITVKSTIGSSSR